MSYVCPQCGPRPEETADEHADRAHTAQGLGLGLSPMPLRLATDRDREDAASGERIPFHRVDPTGLVVFQEFLAAAGWDVDEMVLGRGLARYFEWIETA